MSVMIARFDGVRDVSAGKSHRVTWPELVSRLGKFEYHENKKAVGGWSPAIFRPFCECGEEECPGDRGHRINQNVLEVYALTFDLDKTFEGTPLDQMSADAALQRLDDLGLRYVVHTTHSHAPPAHVSLRVVVALTRPVSGHEWERFWTIAVGHIGIHVEQACRNLGRFWFLPSAKPGTDGWSRTHDGVPLDVDALVAAATAQVAQVAQANANRPHQTTEHREAAFDRSAFRALIQRHDPSAKERQRRDRIAYDIECPWEGEHSSSSPRDTVVSFTDDDVPNFSCLHGHCKNRHWQDFRAFLDPEYAAWRANGFKATEEWKEKRARERTQERAQERKRRPSTVTSPNPTDDISQRRERKAQPTPALVHVHAGLGPRGGYRLTDLGNARRFADAQADRLRYVRAWNRWLAWDGKRWNRDEVGSEITAAKHVVAQLYSNASASAQRAAQAVANATITSAPTEDLDELTKWAAKSTTRARIEGMVSLAQSEPEIAASSTIWDQDAWLLNVANGTIDLRSGEIREHRQSDMITMLAPVDYDPEAVCPRWEQFLARVQPDEQSRTWIQRYLGYAITGDVREQCLSFFYGGGSNGKSVLLDVVLDILGGYGLRAAPDLVLAKHGEAHPTELADLEGKRFVVCSEIEQGRGWAESLIKRITGDQTITARRMRQDFYTFPATHKLVVAANTRPVVRGTDHGIWRRMRLVPWLVRIPDVEQNKSLPDELLQQEAPGILAWLVRGCLAWQNHGLGGADAIDAATAKYRADQDALGRWIADRCELAGDEWCATSSLYESYCGWSKEEGSERPWTRSTWRERMLERDGIGEGLREHGKVRALTGVVLRGVR